MTRGACLALKTFQRGSCLLHNVLSKEFRVTINVLQRFKIVSACFSAPILHFSSLEGYLSFVYLRSDASPPTKGKLRIIVKARGPQY